MKYNFLKSKDSDKGIFLEVEEDSISLSLWKKSNSTTVKLDSEATQDLVEFLKKVTQKDLPKDEIYANNARWEKHIIDTLDRVNPEEAKDEEHD